ncbi:MAG: hypothetical protein OEW37_04165, partial [Rhodospirillaceae bacterium]|nr:hypothetical protein [Rhodospirillaceae bacterium]
TKILSIYLMAVIFSSLYATFANIKIINSDRQYQSSAFEKIENVIAEYPDAILIGTYLCSLPECPFADSIKFTPTMNDKVVKKLNDFIYFEVDYAKLFYPGIGRKSVKSINSFLESGRDVLLVSHNYYALDMLRLEPLVKTNGQSLYRVLGVTGIECPEPDHRDVKKRDKCLSRFLSNNPKTSQPSAGN